jgi:hypothetical protein
MEADRTKDSLQKSLDSNWVGAEKFINDTAADFRKFVEDKTNLVQRHFGVLKTSCEKTEVGRKLLETKVENMEKFLGTPQGTSLEKVMEIVGMTEETTRTHIRREMETIERRMMDTITAKLVQEQRKQTRREGDLEDLKRSMEENYRKQLALALENVSTKIIDEQKARKILEKELAGLKSKIPRPEEGGIQF